VPEIKIHQVTQELEKMNQKQFYGEFNIKFVQGKVVQCKKIESLSFDSTNHRISISESST